MKKRLFALLLALVMVIGTTATGASAGDGLTQDNMSKVILAIKNKLEIGDEYTVFNYDYYDYSGSGTWSFNWQTEDYSKYISAECDEDMHLIYYYGYTQNRTGSAPTVTKAEFLPKAEAAVYRFAPEMEGHIEYVSANYNSWNSAYTYNFVRSENGIRMPDNSVNIQISYLDGSVTNFSASWDYDVVVEEPDSILTEDAAAAKLSDKIKMTLRYYLGYDEQGNRKAFLAYTPDKSYIAVDAATGEIYEEKIYWDRDNGAMSKNEAAMDSVATEEATGGFQATLSEAELQKIQELEDLISSEEAVAVVTGNEMLYIDPNVNMTNVNLRQSGGRYYYRVQMRDARTVDYSSGDYYRGSCNANVDAETGEILYFSATVPQYYDYDDNKMPAELKTVKYTKAECQEIMEKFLGSVSPTRFASSELGDDEYETRLIDYQYNDGDYKYTYGGYHFGYVRVNEGVQLQANYLNGDVDAVSGKIFNYNCNWNDDLVLPSTKGVIDEKAALNSYLGYDGFDLVYELVTDYTTEENFYGYNSKTSTRLVYRTAISPYYVDAFTGKQLNYNGQEYVKVSTSYEYTDIEGTEYERAIELLADMGAGFEGTEFKPDQVITRAEFVYLAQQVPGLSTYSYELKGVSPLTRRIAAKTMIGWLGYGQLAQFDIFKTGYSDNAKIGADYRGYVALAKAYGLMGAYQDNRFAPTEKVTRGEAAQMLINMLNVNH